MGHRCFDVADGRRISCRGDPCGRPLPSNDHAGHRKGDPYTLRVVVRGARGRTPRTGHKHIKACQSDGMYLTARVATDSLTTAKYEHVLVRYGNFGHWLLA